MLVGAAALQYSTPSLETVLHSQSQVCIRKLSPSCNFTVCSCRFIDPFAPFTCNGPSLSRAGVLAHRCQAQSTPSAQKSQGERSFRRRDLQSLKEAFTQQNPPNDAALLSYDESPSQDLQRLKGFLNQRSDPQPKRDGDLEQQRLPKAATRVPSPQKTEYVRDNGARNQLGTQPSAASSGSPQPGNTYKSREGRASKRRGGRIPARGLDALDKLMASQGHTSRALLESLQATVASDDDDMPHAHVHRKDNPKGHSEDYASAPSSGMSRSETAEKWRGSIDTWRPTYDTTTDDPATSGAFASSIEKALSPSTASSTTRPTNVRVLEPSMASLSSEAYAAGDSDMAKPSLCGQEVLLALQKAAMEKAKTKQRTRKVSERASKSKQVASQYESGEWRDAKPITVKPEWAHQIEELERRIENLKNPMPSL